MESYTNNSFTILYSITDQHITTSKLRKAKKIEYSSKKTKPKQNKIKQNKKNHDMMLLSGILDIITQGLTVTMALYSAIIFRFSDNSGHIRKLV